MIDLSHYCSNEHWCSGEHLPGRGPKLFFTICQALVSFRGFVFVCQAFPLNCLSSCSVQKINTVYSLQNRR